MNEQMVKMAQDSLQPALRLAENGTALAVNLLQARASSAAELLEGNLAHVRALAASKDLNAAWELQTAYVESLGGKMAEAARADVVAVEAAAAEAGKILEGSMADAQAQARKAFDKLGKVKLA